MAGVLWIVQLVHYPLFSFVAPKLFIEFHQQHSTRITYIVGPMMILQLLTAAVLAFVPDCRPSTLSSGSAYLFFGLTLVVFAATAFLSIPEHQRLTAGFVADAHNRLVVTNWVRTVAYTIHMVTLFWVLLNIIKSQ